MIIIGKKHSMKFTVGALFRLGHAGYVPGENICAGEFVSLIMRRMNPPGVPHRELY